MKGVSWKESQYYSLPPPSWAVFLLPLQDLPACINSKPSRPKQPETVRAIPIVLDFDEHRLRIAEKVGVYYALNISSEDIMRRIFSITSGKMADAAVQTPPGVVSFKHLLDYIAEGGRVVYTAIENTGGDLSVDVGAVLDKNVTLSTVSSHGLSIPAAVNALAGDKIIVSPFITRCNFSEVDECLKRCENDLNRYMFVSVVY